MRIVIAAGLYAPEIGGPATYVAMLEESLPPHGHTVTVVPFRQVRRYPKLVRHVYYTYLLWRAARHADLIYAMDGVSVGWSAMVVATLRRIPLWLRLGGDYAWEQGQVRNWLSAEITLDTYVATPSSALPLWVRLLRALQTRVARAAKVVIVPSQYLARMVSQWSVDNSKIHVIHSALHPLPDVDVAQVPRRIVTVGRLVPWKGMTAVVRAFQRIQTQYPNATLHIVGDGPERQSIAALVHQYDLASSVILTGSLDKKELARELQEAEVFVLNTAYEGLSHQLLEVMHAGVPIVTTPVGGNSDILTDDMSAQLVTPDDVDALVVAVGRYFTAPDVATRHAAAARAVTNQFTAADEVARLNSLLNTLQ